MISLPSFLRPQRGGHKDKRQFIFICGTSRSGTSTFADLLRAHSRMAMGRERYAYLVFDHKERIGGDLFEKERFCRQLEPDDTHHVALDAYYKQLADRFDDCSHVGDKVPNLNEVYPEIMAAFPNARFFFMLRNVMDVAASFQLRWEAKMQEPEKHKWGADRDAVRAVEEWNRSMEQTLPLMRSGRFKIVPYERLYRDDALLEEVFTFAGLDIEPSVRSFWASARERMLALEEGRALRLTTQHKLAIMQRARFDLYRQMVPTSSQAIG